MTALKKVKFCPKPVVGFNSNLGSVKSNKSFYLEKYQSDNRTNSQQKCIECLKPRSNKNERECKNVVAITFICPMIKVFHL